MHFPKEVMTTLLKEIQDLSSLVWPELFSAFECLLYGQPPHLLNSVVNPGFWPQSIYVASR
jgi:hypothetical protein